MGAGVAPPEDTNAWRWIDALDHAVDRFDDVAIVSLYRPLTGAEESRLAAELAAQAPLRAVYLKRRPREAHGASTADAAPVTPILGTRIDSLEVREHGARFEIRPGNGLSVGLYLDARDARAWVRAHAKGLTVLNLFAYTCGFGVAARLGGASRAVNVDASRKVLEWGEANLALNGFSPAHRDFLDGDCFDWLGRFAKKGEKFGMVIVDPPSFSNVDGRRFRAEKDYPQLAAAAAKVVAPGGILVCCCNLEELGAPPFERQVTAAVGPSEKLAAFGASALDFAQPSALKLVAIRLA